VNGFPLDSTCRKCLAFFSLRIIDESNTFSCKTLFKVSGTDKVKIKGFVNEACS
jgi:hypothetical protein